MRKFFSGHRERDHIAVNGGTSAEQKGAVGLGVLGEEEDCWRVKHMYEEKYKYGRATRRLLALTSLCSATAREMAPWSYWSAPTPGRRSDGRAGIDGSDESLLAPRDGRDGGSGGGPSREGRGKKK